MIDAALRTAAAFVDDNASTTAWDVHLRLSDEQRFAKAQKIKAVASELRALADASETREVRYAEYGALENRLYAFGFSMSPKLRQDVAAAIHRARGPVQPRGGGWLAPS